MMLRRLDGSLVALALGADMVLALACTRDPVMSDGGTTMDTSMDTTTGITTVGTTTDDPDSSTGSPPATTSTTDTGELDPCAIDGSCGQVDLLFVIDNSGSMGEEQLNLARSFQALVDELDDLRGSSGDPLAPDVNIMVTTTDMGHPLCTAFFKPDYTPQEGAPVYSGCNVRINRFTGLDATNPVIIEEACTENCPVDVAPDGHFIHFGPSGSNVPNDDVGTALACIGPQGIDGCGYESPLESMLQAINESACWNDPQQAGCAEDPEWANTTEGFMRDDATLALVLVTDELDCSVQTPNGYSFFTDVDNDVYWNANPELIIPQASSAICFNAGVTCSDPDGDGIYDGCDAQDSEVLQPLSRYTSYFQYLDQLHDKEIVMLTLSGVPPVTSHAPDLPYEPTAGGLLDLVYRNWIDFPYPAGDISPSAWAQGTRAAHQIFAFGDLGPGCTAIDDQGTFTAQALPPVRIRDVCQSLDELDPGSGEPIVRCCMESICSDDFGPAFQCLTGVIAQSLERSDPD